MAMEGVRSSLAALLFLTLVVLAASASAGGGGAGDDAAAGAVEELPLADEEPYMLVAFQNKDGQEIRLLSDKGSETLSPSGFANRSGHWFYAGGIREEAGKGSVRRRRLVPLHPRSPAEGFWDTLGVLVNTDDGEELRRYLLVGMQTSGGDKIRLVVVADQRDFFISGLAQGWFWQPNWVFRDGERHQLLPTTTTLGGNGSSHAEVVASNVLAAMMKDGKTCAARLASLTHYP